MAVYAIGDVQGCLAPLRALLQQLRFDSAHDTLWLTGDLVNRGPDSLGVLRFIKNLGERAVTVLGNHDLHLLAVAAGVEHNKERDTLRDVLEAPDRNELLQWLRTRPLIHYDAALNCLLVHAGLLPQWTREEACRLGEEAGRNIVGDADFFSAMYGDQPDRWDPHLQGSERLRVIVNAMTRLRYCDAQGRMDLQHKGPPGTQPAALLPWFVHPQRLSRDVRIVFGHWSALGIHNGDNVIALDSGCLWGRQLTAVRLDAQPLQFTDVACGTAKSES